MSNGIGYSHALFSYGSNVRKFALEADKKENGGNDNGILDGNEIAVFKQNIKKVAGFDFDFSELVQAQKKSIKVQDNNGNWIYNNATEIANDYKSATSKSTNWLNGKQPNKDIFIPKNKSLFIAYMSEQDFMSSKSSVDEQENLIKGNLQAKKEIEKKEAEKAKSSGVINFLENVGKKIFSK